MSLEAKIELLTAAVEALTRSMQVPIVSREPIVLSPIEILEENKLAAIIEEAHADVPNESTSPESGSQSEPDPDASPLTYDDVKRATNNLSAAKGKEVTIAALAHFGVTRATQLTEAQWGDYVAYANKAAA